jgi:DNA-binding response OmpR family regulator
VSRGPVLIVEDEHLLGNNLQEYLRRRGWQAQLARSGEGALEAFELLRPSVILMDYELPDMDGFQTIGAIRARHDCCACVLMTAHSGEHVITRARESRIAHVLHKPFALSEMERWLLAATGPCKCGGQGR